MRTNYYVTKVEIPVTEDFTLPKHEKVLGSLPDEFGEVTLFTRYWFKVSRKKLIKLEKFT